jgi:hypothetical protein
MAITPNSITVFQTTAAATEETALLSLDGSTPAVSLAVPAGSTLSISDATFSGVALSTWRIQQANDGVAFFDVGLYSAPASSVSQASLEFRTGLVVNGNSGTNVLIRVRVTTPGGAAAVTATLRGYTTT